MGFGGGKVFIEVLILKDGEDVVYNGKWKYGGMYFLYGLMLDKIEYRISKN